MRELGLLSGWRVFSGGGEGAGEWQMRNSSSIFTPEVDGWRWSLFYPPSRPKALF